MSVSVRVCMCLMSAFMNVGVYVKTEGKESRDIDPSKLYYPYMRKHFQPISLHVNIIRVKQE